MVFYEYIIIAICNFFSIMYNLNSYLYVSSDFASLFKVTAAHDRNVRRMKHIQINMDWNFAFGTNNSRPCLKYEFHFWSVWELLVMKIFSTLYSVRIA